MELLLTTFKEKGFQQHLTPFSSINKSSGKTEKVLSNPEEQFNYPTKLLYKPLNRKLGYSIYSVACLTTTVYCSDCQREGLFEDARSRNKLQPLIFYVP